VGTTIAMNGSWYRKLRDIATWNFMLAWASRFDLLVSGSSTIIHYVNPQK